MGHANHLQHTSCEDSRNYHSTDPNTSKPACFIQAPTTKALPGRSVRVILELLIAHHWCQIIHATEIITGPSKQFGTSMLHSSTNNASIARTVCQGNSRASDRTSLMSDNTCNRNHHWTQQTIRNQHASSFKHQQRKHCQDNLSG